MGSAGEVHSVKSKATKDVIAILEKRADVARFFFTLDIGYFAALGFFISLLVPGERLYLVVDSEPFIRFLVVLFAVTTYDAFRMLTAQSAWEATVTGAGKVPQSIFKSPVWMHGVWHAILVAVASGWVWMHLSTTAHSCRTAVQMARLGADVYRYSQEHGNLPKNVDEVYTWLQGRFAASFSSINEAPPFGVPKDVEYIPLGASVFVVQPQDARISAWLLNVESEAFAEALQVRRNEVCATLPHEFQSGS